MDVPVQIAVRLKPPSTDSSSSQCIFSDPGRQAVYTESGQTFHVNQAFSIESSQSEVFRALVLPQVNCFVDGCDTSFIVVGQKSSGKTYTLFGSGCENGLNENDQGIIPRFIATTCQKLEEMHEREFVLYFSWVQIVDNNVHDVVGPGLIRCNNSQEISRYLQRGWTQMILGDYHCIFTVSMEQQWLDSNGNFYHGISTASFCDLASYPEPGLNAMKNIIRDLLLGTPSAQVNYQQSILTELLRDSFGGRAFTWVVGCISSEPRDYQDTIKTLHLTLSCRGIKNYVTINTYPYNDTQVFPENNLGLRFVTNQLVNLSSNAADLFSKITKDNALNQEDIMEINEWLSRKAECEEYLRSEVCATKEIRQKNSSSTLDEVRSKEIATTIDAKPSAPRIPDLQSTDDTVYLQEIQSKFMKDFRMKYAKHITGKGKKIPRQIDAEDVLAEIVEAQSRHCQFDSGHRRTIHPGGASLSYSDLNLLRQVAPKISAESQADVISEDTPKINVYVKSNDDADQKNNEKFLQKNMMFRKLFQDIIRSQARLKELVNQCNETQKIITELSKSSRRSSKIKCHAEKPTTKNQYDKAKANLDMILMKLCRDKNNKKLLQQLNYSKFIIDRYENQLYVVENPNRCDQSSANEIKSYEDSIKMYKKSIQQLKKLIKKDEKRKQKLEIELSNERTTLLEPQKVKEKKACAVRQFTKNFMHWDTKKDKTGSDVSQPSKEEELMLRKEIANLRSSRECLYEQRCILACKWKTNKSLSQLDDCKLLEIEEGVEAIDTAIEYKNSLICGRSLLPALSDIRGSDKDVHRILMERLDKLGHEEMKPLLCRFFRKVVDLRAACALLESTAKAASEEVAMWRTQALAACRQEYRMKGRARRNVGTPNVGKGDDTTAVVHRCGRTQLDHGPTHAQAAGLMTQEKDRPAQETGQG